MPTGTASNTVGSWRPDGRRTGDPRMQHSWTKTRAWHEKLRDFNSAEGEQSRRLSNAIREFNCDQDKQSSRTALSNIELLADTPTREAALELVAALNLASYLAQSHVMIVNAMRPDADRYSDSLKYMMDALEFAELLREKFLGLAQDEIGTTSDARIDRRTSDEMLPGAGSGWRGRGAGGVVARWTRSGGRRWSGGVR